MRIRVDVCRAILLTSVVWFLLDVIVLFYFIDPGAGPTSSADSRAGRYGTRAGHYRAQHDDEPQSKQPSKEHEKPVEEEKHAQPAPPQQNIDPRVQLQLDEMMKGMSFAVGGPGDLGRPVQIDPAFDAEQREKFKLNQFNLMASDMIALNRTVPDYRNAKCRELMRTYDTDHLPLTSIIIVFHNEAWSTLLRTLHSVIDRSPHRLLKEIILIDDKSDREFLREPLAAYITRLTVPTKLVHLEERSGLIRARLRGSGMALGEVLLFLDAHVEVSVGWLEPLIARVAGNRKRVVAPIIDVISDETFEYISASDTTWGGFNWQLNFRWYPVPSREMLRRNQDRASAIQTPTIAGGLFAIDKNYFYEIGTYDEGMQVWGGENLEISFRVWTCGGVLEIVPCSRVGHVFRKQTPYTFPGGTARIIHTNSARTAEVWMDDYREFFYRMTPEARRVAVGDVSKRKELRQRLGCKSFRWYLENIYEESPIPATYYSIGSISNTERHMCLDTMSRNENENVGVSTCHGQGGNQAWALTGKGELRHDELCLASGGTFSGSSVKLEKCGPSSVIKKHIWEYSQKTKQLVHKSSGSCLQIDDQQVMLKSCNSAAPVEQRWELENYQPHL